MILIRMMGGMGNQMFQYAAARALAEKNNTVVKIDLDMVLDRSHNPKNTVYQFDYELHAFNTMQNMATAKEKYFFMPFTKNIFKRIYNKIRFTFSPRRFYKQEGDLYDPNFLKIEDNFCIEGRFQSEKFFKPYEEVIRKEYEFKIEIPDYVKPIEQKIRNSNSVGIQVRRGIIKTPYFYSIMGAQEPAYYEKGLEIITRTNKDIEVFVISDDIQWCKENLKFDHPTTFLTDDIASNNHHVQLYLLSCCKHFVIPNSTFAWWGAWLSNNKNKIVVAPEKWYLNDWDYKDIVPESWVKI